MMKNVAYISIISATFYIALFVTVPLWNFFLAWPILLYCGAEIFISLTIISKKDDEESEKIKLSKSEIESIKFCKDNKLEVDKMLSASITLHQTALSMGMDNDYSVIFVPSEQKEILEKIYTIINENIDNG